MCFSRRDRRRVEARDFLARLEVDDGEAVIVRQLDEDARGRSIRRALERHRPDAGGHRQLPRDRFRRLIDHRDHAAGNRSRHDVLAVGRDVDVVDRALHRDRLRAGERDGVDHVHGARRLRDAHVDTLAIVRDRDVVRAAAQLHARDDRERRRIDGVECVQRFVGEIDPRAVWRAVTPCGTSMSWMTPTTLLVAGSIKWMLSPAALVWMMRATLVAARVRRPSWRR